MLAEIQAEFPLTRKSTFFLSIIGQGDSAIIFMTGIKSLRLSLLMPINSNIGGTDFPCCYVLALLCTFIPQDSPIACPRRVLFIVLTKLVY